MARQRPTESATARRTRIERGQRYATAATFKDKQGPIVVEGKMPVSGEVVLMRRIDLARVIGAGQWPEPITSAVRRLMVDGGGDWARDTELIEKNLGAAAALARAAIIVPPPALIAGDITVDDITADMCKPLFVEENPDPDQLILVEPGDPDPPENGVRVHPFDLSWIATRALILAPGAMAAFRGGSGRALASLDEETEDGAPDE